MNIFSKLFPNLELKSGICNGQAVIKNTQLNPEFVVQYGTKEKILKDLKITEKEFYECVKYCNLIKN